MTTLIRSNGSKWAGEPPDTIAQLLAVLAEHPLDRLFEKPELGNFATVEAGGFVNFFGNFATVSHVFSIDTDEPDVIAALTAAIHANQQRPDYLSQPSPEQRRIAEVEAERAKRRVEFTRIEFHDDGPDRLGRRRYTLFWMADYHPGHPDGEHGRRERGQCFHADPARALGLLRGEG